MYILICLFLSPILFGMRETILQIEYILPFMIIGVCGCLFAHKKVFEWQHVNLSMIDISCILWYLWLLISMCNTPELVSDILNQTMYLGGFMFYIFFRERGSKLGIWLFLYMIIFTALLQILFSYLLQRNNFYSVLQFKGTFPNSAFLGEYLTIGIIALLACVFYFNQAGRRIWRYVLILVLLIFICILYRVMSRASWISLGVGVIFLFWPMIKIRVSRFMKYWWMSLFSILIIVGILYCVYAIRPNSVNGRFLVWQVSVNMVLEKPFVGYGFGGFRQNYMLFQKDYFDVVRNSPFSELASDNVFAFNEFFKVLVEQGSIGFLLVLFLLYNIFYCRYDDKYLLEVRILRTIILAIIIFGCFSYPSEVFPFHVLTVIPVAYLANVGEKKWVLSFKNCYRLALFLSCLLWLCTSVWFYKAYNFACAGWKFHVISLNFHGGEEEFSSLNELYPELSATIEYLLFYGNQLNQAGKNEQAIFIFSQLGRCYPSSFQQIKLGEALYANGEKGRAEIAWKNAIKMVPMLIRPYYLLSKLYGDQERYNEAVLYGKVLLNKKLKVYTPEIYYMKKEIKEVLPEWERHCLTNNE